MHKYIAIFKEKKFITFIIRIQNSHILRNTEILSIDKSLRLDIYPSLVFYVMHSYIIKIKKYIFILVIINLNFLTIS